MGQLSFIEGVTNFPKGETIPLGLEQWFSTGVDGVPKGPLAVSVYFGLLQLGECY